MMLFPVVVHKDPRSAFGVTIPDIPGCFTAGATLDEALRNVQEAVELHLEEADDVPVASALDRWTSNPDYRDGLFALVDIDLAFLEDETVRVNITAKRSALAVIDRVAKARGEDRSEFLIRAALERVAGSAFERPVTSAPRAVRSLGRPAKAKPAGKAPRRKR
jgi:predicted RNase H-like HicB family nuclease/uncharacterized protein (DUF1778 family)